jgi:SpoIVB peptidase S55
MPVTWSIHLPGPVHLVACAFTVRPSAAQAHQKPDTNWNVDDVRASRKGHGRTLMQGTKTQTFEAEVLGMLKNSSPGRDMVLCRLSGQNLERTGFVTGMSGRPVYINGKLLGAVAYAWAFGKEAIAGITSFSQTHGFVRPYEPATPPSRPGQPHRSACARGQRRTQWTSPCVGDFDLSGIGTVTHMEGSCVYGWSHPYGGLGGLAAPAHDGLQV